MIKEYVGNSSDIGPTYRKISPKQKAESLIADKLGGIRNSWLRNYWKGPDGYENMTAKEIILINKQIDKILPRIAKLLHRNRILSL